MNASMDSMKRSLWHKVTSYLLTLFMVVQLTLPSVAAAVTNISNAQLSEELTTEQMFIRSVISTYMYERSKYIPKLPSSYAVQTIAELHSKLKANYIYRLPSEIATDWIPIVGPVTFFVPKERAIYPLYKRVGDKFVQRKVIGNQIKRLIGRTYYKSEFSSEQAQIRQLYANALTVASSSAFKYQFGDTLPEGAADTLKTDFVWPETRNIGGEYVLVPVVHLQKVTVDSKGIDGTHTVEFKKSNATFKSAKISNADLKLQNDTVFRTINDLVIGTKSSISIDESAARIYAGVSFIENSSGAVQGVASGTLYNYGQINSKRNVDIVAGNYQQKTFVHRYKTAYGYEDKLGTIASINAGGGISIRTYNDILLEGATVSANGGSINLYADGSIRIGAVPLENTSSFKVRGGNKNSQGVNYVQSILSAQDNISLYAAGIIEINASELFADEGHIRLLAEYGVSITNEQSVEQIQSNRKWGRKTEDESSYVTIAIRSILDAGKGIVINAEYGDITLKAVDLKSIEGTSATATSGAINLLMAIENDQYNYSSVKKSLFTVKTVNRGHNYETPVYNSIVGGFQTEALSGVNIEYQGDPTLTLEQQVAAISDFNGLEWLSLIRTDNPDINWNSVDLAYEQWDKSSTTLSPAAMAVISIAVAIATSGATLGWAETLTGTIGGSTLNTAIAAGFSSIVSQATVAVANGAVNGDIGGALEDLASSEFVKSVAVAMVTAGAMAELDSTFFTNTPTDAEVLNAAAAEGFPNIAINSPKFIQFQDKLRQLTFAQQAAQALTNSTVSAGVNTIVNGEGFDHFSDAFLTSLGQNAINIIGKNLANKIGDAAKNDENFGLATKYIAHAAVGCVLGAAQSVNNNGNSDLTSADCISGAGGALIGEIIAEKVRQDFFDDSNQLIKDKLVTPQKLEQMFADYKSKGVDFARLSAALTAFSLGANVDIATGSAGNVAENNAFWFLVIPAFIALEKAYTVYEYVVWADDLGEAIKSGNQAEVDRLLQEKFEDVAFDAAVGLIPGGKTLDKVIEKIRTRYGNDSDFDKVTEALEHYKNKVDSGQTNTITLADTPPVEPKLEHHISGRTPIAKSTHTLDEQRDAIEGVKNGNIDLDAKGNSVRKGNYGEMVTDDDLVNRGFTPLHDRITDIDAKLASGIDGIFEKDGKYFIVESKFGCSNLNTCRDDNRQMSESWIFDRLQETNLPASKKALILDNYTPVLAKITKSGVVTYRKLKPDGYVDKSVKSFADIFGD